LTASAFSAPECRLPTDTGIEVLGGSGIMRRFGEEQPATYYRTTAARARRLKPNATTPRVKQYLDKMIAHCDRLAGKAESGVSSARSATIGRPEGSMIRPRSSKLMSRSY
jgi:hypothetical protein